MSIPGITEWEYVTKRTEQILKRNMNLKDITIWFVGGSVGATDSITMMSEVIKDDGEMVKIAKEIPGNDFMEIKTPKDMVRYAMLHISQYILIQEFNFILR